MVGVGYPTALRLLMEVPGGMCRMGCVSGGKNGVEKNGCEKNGCEKNGV
jgi:hypothetical protein